jgi:hypothetical protein
VTDLSGAVENLQRHSTTSRTRPKSGSALKETVVKYLCLVYLSPEEWNSAPDEACMACGDELRASGHFITGTPLHPAHTATTVRMRNGRVSVTDGPFAETKEQLAGFYLIDARDLNEAIQLASRIPPAQFGSIEVRPTRELMVSPQHAAAAAAR